MSNSNFGIETLWILGASDPEMSEIETVLAAAGQRFVHASVDGVRCHPGNANKGGSLPDVGEASRVVFVECRYSDIPEWIETVIVDHHAPGDPGADAGPEEYLRGSSLGQVLALLGLEATAAQRVIAAADHCLGAAYKGLCPGVSVESLKAFRLESRSRWQADFDAQKAGASCATEEQVAAKRAEMASAIDAALVELESAEKLSLGGEVCADMRRPAPVKELPEAALQAGLAYVSGPLKDRSGREKYTVSGSPEVVKAWLETWAPAEGLVDSYGVPARGFAGAFKP